jgi:hypothetical protein
MSITIVQSSFTPNTISGTGGTATGTLTNPVTAGNAVLIGFAGGDGNATKTVTTASITDNKANSGYSQLTFDNTTTAGQGLYIATNITNGPSTFDVPFTNASATSNVIIGAYELSGLLASPADFANLLTSGFASTFNLSFTTTVINEIGIAILSNSTSTAQTAVTMTNGWTLDFTDLTGSFHSAFAHMALPTAGSGNSIQGSTASADVWNASIVSLKPSTGGGSNTAPIAWIT